MDGQFGAPVPIPLSENERPLIQAISIGLQLCFLKTHTTCLNGNGIMLISRRGTLLISKIPFADWVHSAEGGSGSGALLSPLWTRGTLFCVSYLAIGLNSWLQYLHGTGTKAFPLCLKALRRLDRAPQGMRYCWQWGWLEQYGANSSVF